MNENKERLFKLLLEDANEEDDIKNKIKSKKPVHRHPTTPPYYPADDRYAIELDPNTYKPRDLLNLSVKAFWLREGDDLSLLQQNAVRGFCSRFKQPRAKFDCNVGKEQQLAAQRECVESLKRYIDEFFFFGQLRRQMTTEYGIDVVKLPNNDPAAAGGWDGYTRMRAGQCRLKVNIGTGTQVFPLLSIVETLVHEMAHAYLMVFSDQKCEHCYRDRINTIGLEGDGHGPVFLQLHSTMVTTMRGWDDSLKDLAAEDCPGKFTASESAQKLAKEAYGRLTATEKASFNRRRIFTNANIYLTSNGEVIVKKALRDKAFAVEDDMERRKRIKDQDDVDILTNMMRRHQM